MNLKTVCPLYREERLTVRKRRGRKRAPGTRAPIAIPQESNRHWSLEFVSGGLLNERKKARIGSRCGPFFESEWVIA
ncbi:hypothetical protein [Sphingomonas oryzagri]